jgi:ERCC4-related helicase
MPKVAGNSLVLSPGSRILIRDAEWLVRRVDRTSTGNQVLSVVGLSEMVRNKEASFLAELEKSIAVLNPAETTLVPDASNAYRISLLFIEALLRQTQPADDKLYIGHRAAMDLVPYQLDPAIQALRQARQRILIADSTGLGKTLEAGILLSELIRRGRGKRILVVVVKSMLTQFQKEMWSRFTIPLVRLDSIGIQRIRSRIPTNHNPFFYYDKSIISIDTLKSVTEYRHYLENSFWDVIVIDEAQNVAERGTRNSRRSGLARLLATKSDTLIMLSATPHDGKARSFASLMNMLDRTAIANQDIYGPEDIKGLFIRRFKKDIQDQVKSSFMERIISLEKCNASEIEEDTYNCLKQMQFKKIDQRRSAQILFRVVLEKALFSSPAACIETIDNRIVKLKVAQNSLANEDIKSLSDLRGRIERIGKNEFTKYNKLVSLIKDPVSLKCLGWTGQDTQDRLVIFTERLETLRFLKKHLPSELGLTENQVVTLDGSGGMSDVEQQEVVEDFGRDQSPIRLLIASDIASEGINLHFLCHRMIHFDIPWSFTVFQQRNGRIDRYGQTKTPQIYYLMTESKNDKIKGDLRILELLIQKDEQACKNIGDPRAITNVYDSEEEELITADAIASGQTAEQFDEKLSTPVFDPLAFLMSLDDTPTGADAISHIREFPSLFKDDYSYVEAALQQLNSSGGMQVECNALERKIEFYTTDELKSRFEALPEEMKPQDGLWILSPEKDVIQNEIRQCRKKEKAWPRLQYLWPLHPVVDWLNEKVLATFGRQEAPVITLHDVLAKDEYIYLMLGLIPNRKSHPLVQKWFGVTFNGQRIEGIEDFEAILKRTGLGQRAFPNRGDSVDIASLQSLLPEAVSKAKEWMSAQRKTFEDYINPKLNDHLTALEALRNKHEEQLELRFADMKQPETSRLAKKERERREIEKIFDEYIEWIEDTMTTEDNPYIQVVAVLRGTN